MAFNFRSLLNLSGGLKSPRPPYESAYIYVLLFFVGMLVSKYLTTYFRADMLPVGGVTKVNMANKKSMLRGRTASVFTSVKDKNIFNSDHFIPDSLSEKSSGQGEGEDNSKPILTSLPLKLVGTIIHGAREKSVATIELSGKDIQAVMAGEEIDGMARIRDIQRYKVIFRNLQNRKLEYIEIKEENKIQMGVASNGTTPSAGDVQTNFTFTRTQINKYLDNLPQVLQDAKAVPYIAPGSGGEVSGFKLVAIKTGSIYEKLGLKRGDIIKGVNGEPVDSPNKAMELYQALKNSDSIQLEINRDGSATTLNYMLE